MARRKRPKAVQVQPKATVDLRTFAKFKAHPLVAGLLQKYRQDAVLADYATATLVNHLEEINDDYVEEHRRTAFTTIEGRVKAEESFLRKLYLSCRQHSPSRGLTKATLDRHYSDIKDLAGVRFSCPYFDEVIPAIQDLVRPRLAEHGHASDLRKEQGLQDKDYLDEGDGFGYRSHHFYVKVLTAVDIYDRTELCLCEVQARTELQHVWAVKSHDLLYKPDTGWDYADNAVQDMRQVSNALRAADQFLVSIRDRIITSK